MKSSRTDDRLPDKTSSRPHICWNKDLQTQLLRVELADGSFFLFPYAHLDMVKFEQDGETDLLHLRFANHEIQITGKRLRELGLAFQKLVVEWVRSVPERYAGVAAGDAVCVTSIKVSELQPQQ
jgi:hypothetical protein